VSHIPNSAMKHAGPVHHDSAPEARAGKPNRAENGQGLGLPAWLAIGGTLVVVLIIKPFGILGDMRRDKLLRRMHGE